MDTLTASLSYGHDDYWSDDATFMLIEAWGHYYIQLNRENLRQKHWQEVANAVNNRHFHLTITNSTTTTKHQPDRTDIQCKNRIDTLKKKYKVEKARVLDTNGAYTSPWPFYMRLDALLDMYRVPVGLRSTTSRRPSTTATPLSVDDSHCFSRKFSDFAAAAMAATVSEGSTSRSDGESLNRKSRKRRFDKEVGFKEVVNAIERLGQIYEKVEEKKQRQMVELEKQRMQFTKELECQRMQLIVDTHVQLHKINSDTPKRSSAPSEKFSSERYTDEASPEVGVSWNVLAMKCFSLSCGLDGGINF